MKKIAFILALISLSIAGYAQNINAKRLTVSDSIWLNGRWVKQFSDDSTMGAGADNVLPTQGAVKGAILANKIFINVKDYGAKGDSSTDNTLVLQNVFNITPQGAIIYFPAGIYLVSDSISINKSCTIMGAGGLMTYDQVSTQRNRANSEIVQSSNSKSLFVVNAPGVQFDNVGMLNANNSPSLGAGIKFENGNEFRINNCHINNFYKNVDVINGIYWVIHNSELQDAVLYNLSIADSVQPDGGDATITNSYFTSGRYAGTISLKQYNGGGLKISNTKFQGSNDMIHAPFGFVEVNLTHGTSILMITNCSFENMNGFGIKIMNSDNPSAGFGYINIHSNQFNQASSAYPDFHIIEINNSNPSANFMTGINVTNNILGSYNDSLAVMYFKNLNYLSVYGNNFKYVTAPTDSFVNCVNVGTNLKGKITADSMTLSSGSVSNPSINFGNAAGIYSSLPNRLDFSTGGTMKVSILNSGSVAASSLGQSLIFNNLLDYSTNSTGINLTSNSINFKVGNITVGQFSSSNNLIINNKVVATQYELSDLNSAPLSATDIGTKGEIRITSNYIYICVAANTWVRTALTTW